MFSPVPFVALEEAICSFAGLTAFLALVAGAEGRSTRFAARVGVETVLATGRGKA